MTAGPALDEGYQPARSDEGNGAVQTPVGDISGPGSGWVESLVKSPGAGRQQAGNPPLFTIGAPGRVALETVSRSPMGSTGTPDATADSFSVGELEVRAASVRGRSHRSADTPRQDVYAIGSSPDVLVIAVCDGVGSAEMSHHAAHIAATTAVDVTLGLLADRTVEKVDWIDIFISIAATIFRDAQDNAFYGIPTEGLDFHHATTKVMATTLTVAVCNLLPDNESWPVTVAWVGDSPAWIVTPRGWRAASEAKTGLDSTGMASNASKVLPVSPEHVQVESHRLSRGETLLVMTDGIGDPLGANADGMVADAISQWWKSPPDQFTFAAQVDFARQSFTDDRTCVGVWFPSRPDAG